MTRHLTRLTGRDVRAGPPAGGSRAGGPRVGGVAAALLVHAAATLLSVGFLAVAAGRVGTTLGERLSAWDGGWFVRLATQGYLAYIDVSNPAVDQRTGGLAFFPVYPILMRVLSAVTGLSAATGGIVVSVVAGFVAAAGVYVLTTRLATPVAALFAVAVWSLLPMSVVFSMVYTEALFTALAVWALVLAMRERFLLAGLLALVAGLTRATGLALGVAVVAGIVLSWRRSGRFSWRMGAGGVLAMIGTPLWWVLVWARSGQPDGWFVVQREFWGSQFDFGASLLGTVGNALAFRLPDENNQLVVIMVTVAVLMTAVVLAIDLVVRTVRDATWLVPTTYAVAALGLTLGGAGYAFSKVRFVLTMVPLVIPVALALARARRPVAIAVVLVFGVAGAWWGAFMLSVWRSAI